MNKNTLVLASLASVVLALSACGGGSSDGPESPAPVDPAASEPTVSEPPRSPRGNIIKMVGEADGIPMEEGSDDWALNFTVTDIEVDPACTGAYAEPAVNGHLVAISVEATTGPDPKFSDNLYNGVSFEAVNWKAIAANGTTVNTIHSPASYSCFEEAAMVPRLIGPAEKVVGKVVLDVPDAAGTLVYSVYGTGGWEWEYGTM